MATKRPSLRQGMKPAGGVDRAAEVARDLAATVKPSSRPAPPARSAGSESPTAVVGIRFARDLHELLVAVAEKRTARAKATGMGAVTLSDVVRHLVERAAGDLRRELEG